MPRFRFAAFIALFLVAPVALAQEAADAKALEFLRGLGGSIDDEILGEDVLVIRVGSTVLGEMSIDLDSEELQGREVYAVRAEVGMEIPGGPTHRMEASSHLGADLTTIDSSSHEVEASGGKEKVKDTTITRTGAGLRVRRLKDEKETVWEIPATAGLLEGGADYVVYSLLARANPAAGTRMTFLDRHLDKLHAVTVEALGPSEVEIQAGKFEVVGFRATSREWDDDTGEPKMGEDGKQAQKIVETFMSTEGRFVLVRFVGNPVRMERKGGEAPSEDGDVHPAIDAVSKYFLALAEGDAAAVQRIIDWDSIYEAWSRGPGRAEITGKTPEELRTIRKDFPGNFSTGLIQSADEEAREGLRMLSTPSFWVVEKGEDGHVIVQMTEEMRQENESLASLVFKVGEGKDGTWRLLSLPGL